MINVNNFLSNKSTFSNEILDKDYAGIIAGIKVCSDINGISSILIDFDKRKPIFMSKNLIYLDEATIEDYKRTCENPYWSLVSDDTLDILAHIHEDYSSLKEMMPKDEYEGHLCIMDYPIIIRGRDFYINSRFSPIHIEDGRIKLGLFSFAPSNKREISFLVITTSGKRWAYDFEKRSFKEFDLGLKLTITEKAILQRAKKGMSNDEIANDLFLSINTIKSSKMHIFKKLNVTSISDAIVVIGNYKLL